MGHIFLYFCITDDDWSGDLKNKHNQEISGDTSIVI